MPTTRSTTKEQNDAGPNSTVADPRHPVKMKPKFKPKPKKSSLHPNPAMLADSNIAPPAVMPSTNPTNTTAESPSKVKSTLKPRVKPKSKSTRFSARQWKKRTSPEKDHPLPKPNRKPRARAKPPPTNPTKAAASQAYANNIDASPLVALPAEIFNEVTRLVLLSTEPILINASYTSPGYLSAFTAARSTGEQMYYSLNTFRLPCNTPDDLATTKLWLTRLNLNRAKRMRMLRKLQFVWFLSDPTLVPPRGLRKSMLAKNFGKDWIVSVTLPLHIDPKRRFSHKDPLRAEFNDGTDDNATVAANARRTKSRNKDGMLFAHHMVSSHANVMLTTLEFQNSSWFIFFSKVNVMELAKDMKERGSMLFLSVCRS